MAHHQQRLLAGVVSVLALLGLAPAQGTCAAGWIDGLDILDATNGEVVVLTSFETGGRPGVVAGGRFTRAGADAAAQLALWRDGDWYGLGTSAFATSSGVSALCTYDDGTGAALYVAWGYDSTSSGSTPVRIRRYDGTSWTLLPQIGAVSQTYAIRSMIVADIGFGTELIVAGLFAQVGTLATPNVAAWNGSSWRALGTGLGGIPPLGSVTTVEELAMFDDGTGLALHAGGYFGVGAQGVAPRVARWDGVAWSAVGGALPGSYVGALEVYDSGAGAELYVAGALYGGGHLVRWTGSGWAGVGGGLSTPNNSSSASSLEVRQENGRSVLYVGGVFTRAGTLPVRNLAAWDGTVWSAAGGGVDYPAGSGGVAAMLEHDDGSGPRLLVAGVFSQAGMPPVAAGNIARFDGATWSGLRTSGVSFTSINDFATVTTGAQAGFYAAGFESGAGIAGLVEVASFDGQAWRLIGTAGATSGAAFNKLVSFDGGSGPALHVAGVFTSIDGVAASSIARWNGTAWSPLGTGLLGLVSDLCPWNDGGTPKLVAVGQFSVAVPGGTALNIAAWNGTFWEAVGTGLNAVNGLNCAATYFGGTTTNLYVGAAQGNIYVPNPALVWRLTGGVWQPIWSPTPPFAWWPTETRCLRVLDFGFGPALLAATAHPFAMNSFSEFAITIWDGSGFQSFARMTSDVLSRKTSLEVYDDGSGVALYAAGGFTAIDGTPVGRVARVSSTIPWSSVGSGVGGIVNDLAIFDAGAGPWLLAGGALNPVAGAPSVSYAAWGRSAPLFRHRPAPAAGVTNGTASFAVSATGLPPLSYQWRRNGLPIAGATSPTLSLSGLSPLQGGAYDVTASNPCGSSTTPPVPLDVRPLGLSLSTIGGSGSARFRIVSGHPLQPVFTVVSFDPANWTAPGAGPVGGLHIPLPGLIAQVQTGAPPFVQTLDALGGADFSFPGGSIPPLLSGASTYGISAAFDSVSGALLGVSNISHVILR